MAQVNLDALWLNYAIDSTQARSFQNAQELNYSRTKDGEVRSLANGRTRAVLRGTSVREYDVKLQMCTRADVTWLEKYVGDVMCLRDDRGRKIFGVYLTLGVEEMIVRNDYADVSFKFIETTYNETA